MSALEFPEPIRRVDAPPAASSALSGSEHPLQPILKRADDRSAKLFDVRSMYGSALAMRLQSEDLMAQEVGRLPGIPSSHVMLDTVRGADETLDYSEVLNRASRGVPLFSARAPRRPPRPPRSPARGPGGAQGLPARPRREALRHRRASTHPLRRRAPPRAEAASALAPRTSFWA